MANVYLPSIGGQIEETDEKGAFQSSPLLNTYSPRLFGSPPQLTGLNDMRLMSSDGSKPGPVGDFYLTKILQNAQIANFTVGKALFTGGMSSIANIIRVCSQYAYAIRQYDIFDTGGNDKVRANQSTEAKVKLEEAETAYNSALGTMNDDYKTKKTEDGAVIADLEGEGSSVVDTYLKDALSDSFGSEALAGITASILTSLSVQQPFYTFERDWSSYINNVKMMINTAIIMLGLNDGVVRIGDKLQSIAVGGPVDADTDVWANYRFITADKELGTVNGIDRQNGDTTQYVSFMVEPQGSSESYSNSVGESQIYASVINQGSSIGNEIAFITNSSASGLDDAVVNIAGGAISAAEGVLSAMTAGVGRFTAAIAGSMARTFIGDHTIYPQVFQSHTSTSSKDFVVHLVASAGDPYSYLTEVLVPYFFILGMALPQLSKNNASAYSFPPLVQVNVPGLWGTRLGMVTSVSVNKNPSGKDFSVHGFPLSIDVTISVTDLQHVLLTSPMDKASLFLNNSTMFDYIAQCAGVDKYRVNASIRLVSRLALAASANSNFFRNIGNAVLNDFTSFANRMSGIYNF